MILQFQDVEQQFGEWTFGPVSFELAPQAFAVLLGKSGSGKSTLLHFAGGMMQPKKGKILFQGKDIYAGDPSAFRKRALGFIFQEFHLLPQYSAERNVMLPLLLQNVDIKEASKRAKKLLERVGLTGKEALLPQELSGGQRQRVAIARALVHEPKILLADEPTGNLDEETGKQILRLLMDMQQETGCTMLVVTHDREVAEHAEQTLVLQNGQLKK